MVKMLKWIAVFLLLGACAYSLNEGEAGFDEEAWQFERRASLGLIDTNNEVSKYYALKEQIEEEDARNSPKIPDICWLVKSGHLSPIPLRDTECLNVDNVDNDVDDDAEEMIFLAINKFTGSNKTYGRTIRPLCIQHQKSCQKTGEEFLPSDIAKKLARWFRSKGEIGLALKFYLLSQKSPRVCAEYVYLEIADAFVEYINATIESTRPTKPTPEIFSALMKAIYYNSLDDDWDGIGSIGEAKNIELIKHRDLIVRWPFSPNKVFNDKYYGPGKLVSVIYKPGFVSSLFDDIREIQKLWSLKKFNGSEHDDNIFHYLYGRGFICRKGYLGGNPQYVLINEKGYIVRIKCKDDQWQFTVGLVLKNPYNWHKHEAARLLKGSNESNNNSQYGKDAAGYTFLDEHQFNELFKIRFGNGMVQIVPSTFFLRLQGQEREHVDYWRNHHDSNDFMNTAHYNIEPVGRRKKPNARLDTSSIDIWCAAVDPQTGEIN